MKTKDYLKELEKELNVTLDIKQNTNIPSVGNIIVDNLLTDEICPFEDIFDEVKFDYCVIYPDGDRKPHPNKELVKIKIEKFIKINKEDPELYADCKIN